MPPTSVSKRFKIIFFGSSDFSVPVFESLFRLPHEMTAVVTIPDRPKGRGLRVVANPVRRLAEERKIPVHAPESLRAPEAEKEIKLLHPDVFVVASYGKLIPGSWLQIPSKAAFNVHPSLLPKYRGAAPIAWQILDGEKEVGVSIAEVTKELDAGDIFEQIRIPMEKDGTSRSLSKKLAELGGKALAAALIKLERGALDRTPQDSSQSSYARQLTKDDGMLNLLEPAEILERKVRAFDPWPGTFIEYPGGPLRILEGLCDSTSAAEAAPGVLLSIPPEGHLRIQTGEGTLAVSKVQLSGRRVISGKEFANGERLKPGFSFLNPSR